MRCIGFFFREGMGCLTLRKPFLATARLPPHSPVQEREDEVEVEKRLGRVLAVLHHARCCNKRDYTSRSFSRHGEGEKMNETDGQRPEARN
jgi:hypothetical protein